MAMWFELVVMLLATYAVGLGLGWLVWARPTNDMGE